MGSNAASVEGDDMYGYGEAAPHDDEVDFGYEEVDVDVDVETVSNNSSELKRSKRRCSITKYSLEGDTPLNAASVISDFRNGIVPNGPTTTSSEPDRTGLAIGGLILNDNTMADSSTSASIANMVAVKEVNAIISQDTETPGSPTSTRRRKRNNILTRFFRATRQAQAA